MFPEDLFKNNTRGYWYDPAHGVFDFRGRYHVFNRARKVTLWRKLRAKLGFAERDTLLANRKSKPQITQDEDGH